MPGNEKKQNKKNTRKNNNNKNKNKTESKLKEDFIYVKIFSLVCSVFIIQ